MYSRGGCGPPDPPVQLPPPPPHPPQHLHVWARLGRGFSSSGEGEQGHCWLLDRDQWAGREVLECPPLPEPHVGTTRGLVGGRWQLC